MMIYRTISDVTTDGPDGSSVVVPMGTRVEFDASFTSGHGVHTWWRVDLPDVGRVSWGDHPDLPTTVEEVYIP